MREGDGPPSPFFIPRTKGLAGDDMCILESERLILRPPRPTDIQSMTVWLSDFDVAKMTSRVPHPYCEGDAEAFLALGEAHCFVKIALAVDCIQPGEVVSRNHRVLIFAERLTIVLGCGVVVLPGVVKHADQGIGSGVVRTAFENLLILSDCPVLLLGVDEQRSKG